MLPCLNVCCVMCGVWCDVLCDVTCMCGVVWCGVCCSRGDSGQRSSSSSNPTLGSNSGEMYSNLGDLIVGGAFVGESHRRHSFTEGDDRIVVRGTDARLYIYIHVYMYMYIHCTYTCMHVHVYMYRISSNRGRGFYFFRRIFDPASKRGRPLFGGGF